MYSENLRREQQRALEAALEQSMQPRQGVCGTASPEDDDAPR